MPHKITTTLRIPDEDRRLLRQHAQALGVVPAELLRTAIREKLDQLTREHGEEHGQQEGEP